MRAREAGFTLVEVLVSVGVIGVVLTAVTTFFVRSMVITNLQGARQAAIQVAATAMEELRSVSGAEALDWLRSNAPATAVQLDALRFTRSWDVPEPTALIPATVHVTWTGTDCVDNRCEYSATTLISTAGVEPIFDVVVP